MRKHFRYSRERKNPFLRLTAAGIPLLLMAMLLCQAAFATTYVITDGPRVYTYTAFTSDPQTVLEGAGVELDERDSYTADASAITINRAQSITVVYHGKASQVSSQGETVQQLLSRLDIEPEEEDVLSLPPETPVQDGMILRIDRVVRQQQTYTVTDIRKEIPCTADYLPAGTEDTLAAGHDGELLRTVEVTYTNGVETQRNILKEDVISPSAPRIVATGTGNPLPAFDPGAIPRIGPDTITLPTGEILTYTHTGKIRATAYTHTDKGCNTVTATGSTVHIGTVAVDPRYIPYGTRMFIMASDGSYVYGVAEAEDCGGDIIGDRVDLYLPTFEDCIAFGRRDCTVYFLG